MGYIDLDCWYHRRHPSWKVCAMKKIILSGQRGVGRFTFVDDDIFELYGALKWHIDKDGYATRIVKSKRQSLHRLILGASNNIDHKNGNRLDNRRQNLREATHQENMRNRGAQSNSKTGIKGVSWDKITQKWVARIKFNGKALNLGRFVLIEDAKKAYNIAALKYFGEFARLND